MGCISSSPHQSSGNRSLTQESEAMMDTYDIPKAATTIDTRRVSAIDALSPDHRGSAILYNPPADAGNTDNTNNNNNKSNDKITTQDSLPVSVPAIIYNASDNIPFGSIFGNAKTEFFKDLIKKNAAPLLNIDNPSDNNDSIDDTNTNNNNNKTDENTKTDDDNNENESQKNIYYWRLKLQDINNAMINSHTRDVFIGLIKESIFENKSKDLLNRHFLYNFDSNNNSTEAIVNGYAFSPKTGKLYTVYPNNSETIHELDGDYYKWVEKDSLLEFVLDYNEQSLYYRVLNDENEQLFEYNKKQYKENLRELNKQNKKNKNNKKNKKDDNSNTQDLSHKQWIKLFDNIELCNYRFAITLKGNDYIKLSLINPV